MHWTMEINGLQRQATTPMKFIAFSLAWLYLFILSYIYLAK